MRILWITNAPFPDISNKLNLKEIVKGWVYSAAYDFINYNKNIHLAVASIYQGNTLKQVNHKEIIHYLIPRKVRTKAIRKKNDKYWKQITQQFKPDIVHIHGTEYPYSYSYIRACGAENVVVSIQGLVSVIERYYLGGIKKADLLKTTTFWDFIRNNTSFAQHKDMQKRGKFEKMLIQNIKHVIGRTTWDQNHTWALNPKTNYHFCNETLRPTFYDHNWDINKCEKFSIFISQAYYPIKGIQQLIKALPLVLKYFPNTKIYVAGKNVFNNKNFLKNGFGKYISSQIKKYKLTDRIKFIGLLSEEEMCRTMIQSHIFVSPSMIENSSNSIGEAQILGVPCIASYVGGTPDMIDHGNTGFLYRYEEYEMLASYICNIFSNDKLAVRLSEKSKISASNRHNKEQNAITLYNIYSKIVALSNKSNTLEIGRIAEMTY
jgi:glycosyltransferase involved in cell wall biosynthesis